MKIVSQLAQHSVVLALVASTVWPIYASHPDVFWRPCEDIFDQQIFQNAYDPAGNLTNRLDAAGNQF